MPRQPGAARACARRREGRASGRSARVRAHTRTRRDRRSEGSAQLARLVRQKLRTVTHRHDIHSISEDAIDDPVGAFEDFA